MSKNELIPQEVIESRIYLLRGKKVMLDMDLARLYGVETKALKRAVKRNIYRFPADFAFELTGEESKILRCQNGTSSWGGQRYLQYAFAENGVAMLSSVLNSRRAIEVNIQIMRTFTRMREFLLAHADLQRKLDVLEKKYDSQFRSVFDAISALMKVSVDRPPRIKTIRGFKPEK